MKKAFRSILAFALLAIVVANPLTAYAAQPATAAALGDLSRGNHPLSGLGDTQIIVPRPASSQYPVIAVLDSNGVSLTDISDHWAEKEIRKCVEAGLVSGFPDGTFKPNSSITYAEFATMVARLQIQPVSFTGGVVPMNSAQLKIRSDKWYYNALRITAEAGFFGGSHFDGVYSTTENAWQFEEPEAPMSRQHIVLYLSRAIAYDETDLNWQISFTDLSEFDSRSNNAALTALKRMAKHGIITGRPDGSFDPLGTVTRAEFCAILMRLMDEYRWDKGAIHDNLYGNYYLYNWQEEMKIIDLANADRTAEGVAALKYDADLHALARIKAIDRDIYGYDGHDSPIYGGPIDMAAAFGYELFAGENLTTTSNSATGAHSAWQGSKQGHRENYMNPLKHKIGCAIGESNSVEWFGW